jgi:hypothetical protein
MNDLDIPATARTPRILLSSERALIEIDGESYPEDSRKFYDLPVRNIANFLEQKNDIEITFNFKLKYFNSSSAKIIMNLLHMLESSASNGNSVSVNWHCFAEDDNMRELGEEFAEDLSAARFTLVEH